MNILHIAVLLLFCTLKTTSLILSPSLKLISSRHVGISSESTTSTLLRASVVQDIGSSAIALGGSLAWLQLWIVLAKTGNIDPKLSRKVIHTGSAPLFMALWPLYSSADISSRFIASSIPILLIGRLLLAGSKTSPKPTSSESELIANNDGKGDDIVGAISRSGDRKEALGGPLIYTIVLSINSLLFFRDSPIGIISTCQMAAGDGMADIIGRRWGKVKWPFSDRKSIVGSLAFVLSAFLACSAILAWLSFWGCLSFSVAAEWPKLLLISIICAAVELVPIGDDNITVPAVAALTAMVLFSSQLPPILQQLF